MDACLLAAFVVCGDCQHQLLQPRPGTPGGSLLIRAAPGAGQRAGAERRTCVIECLWRRTGDTGVHVCYQQPG